MIDEGANSEFNDIKWKLAQKDELDWVKLPDGSKYSTEVQRLDKNKEIFFYAD